MHLMPPCYKLIQMLSESCRKVVFNMKTCTSVADYLHTEKQK
uniref:Uncharacterized protein n=1 Tax=Arundo donax TaxID=35708 RepID=A0A0A9AH87_ARUDO